eukprot:609049_1
MAQAFVADALTITSTCSEKSGSGCVIKVGQQYNKRLLMYVAWIIHTISSTQSRFGGRIFWRVSFNYYAFMRYEILGEERPPPKKRENVCIVGDCLVLMASGVKAAKDIRAGDMVQTSNGCLAEVMCTVTQRIEDVIQICKIGECYVTPEHPIRMSGSNEWIVPYEVVGCMEMYVDQINNFVLKSEHHVIVDNVECITLGHGFEDPVVKHPVWGTEVVSRFLESFPSFPDVVINDRLRVKYLI